MGSLPVVPLMRRPCPGRGPSVDEFPCQLPCRFQYVFCCPTPAIITTQDFFLHAPMHVNNMQCNSASYRSITGGIISNIIWFIIQIFLYTQAQPFRANLCHPDSLSQGASLQRACLLPLLSHVQARFPLTVQVPFRAAVLGLVIQNQSETEHFS